MKLHCNIRGVEHGNNLIFLHGLFGSHRNLLPIARAFEKQHRVFLPDMRNHGKSPHSLDFDYCHMADDLQELINDHHISNPILVGHSMGGKVAMTYALHHQVTCTMIILDIAPVTYEFDYATVIDNLLAIDVAKLESRAEADLQLQQHYQNKSFRDFLLQNLERDITGFRWRANLPVLRENLPAICDFPQSSHASSNRCLFIAGEDSTYVQEQHRPTIAQYFPHYKFHYVCNAGHWLHADQPQLVIDTIEKFIQQV